MTKNENGGNNYRNIERLGILMEYLKVEKNYVPKYCVFQFTNVIRDIVEFQNSHLYDMGKLWENENLLNQAWSI